MAVTAEPNEALRAVAEIAQRFAGHGLLAGDPARPDVRPQDRHLWLCSVIEPDAWGAGGVREAFWGAAGLDDRCPG